MSEQQKDGTGFDLGAIDTVVAEQEQGYVLHLRDHAGDPMYYTRDDEEHPVTWTVAGEHSALYREQQRIVRDRYFKGRRRGTITPDDIEEQQIDLLSRVSLGFDGFMKDGEPVPFTRETARDVLARAPWIRQQVDQGTADHAGLFRISSSS